VSSSPTTVSPGSDHMDSADRARHNPSAVIVARGAAYYNHLSGPVRNYLLMDSAAVSFASSL
jgi:hypothetical protein